MSELPLIAVTDSATSPRPLPEQIERLAKLTELRPQAVILRAKALDKAAYRTLALQAQQSCEAAGIPLILHSDWQLARELGISMLHLPLALLRQILEYERAYFTWLSTSVHSVGEAQEAQALGATVLIAGHIFTTQCKAGLAPRASAFCKRLQRCKLAGLRYRRHQFRCFATRRTSSEWSTRSVRNECLYEAIIMLGKSCAKSSCKI